MIIKPKHKEKNSKINILLFISIILLFVSIVNVNALIIGKDGHFKGKIDKLRIYNRALTEEEVRQYYYSNFYKYYIDKWNFYTEQTNLTHGTYTYQGFAIDGAANKNQTEMRTITINNPPTHSTPLITSTHGTNYTSEDLTCYNQSTYDLDGDLVINIIKWYKNGIEQLKLENLFTITSGNTSVGENWSCSITPFDSFEYGITRSSNDLTIICVDTDEDGICDDEDQCPNQNQGDVPSDTDCAYYKFNSSGCIDVTYVPEGTVVENISCHPDKCKRYTNNKTICGEEGSILVGNCIDYEYVCEYDPDINIVECARNFSKGIDQVICRSYGDFGCWDDQVEYWDPAYDTACCGDDVNISDRADECWADDTNSSGCCWGLYITDPDSDGRFCNEVGKKLNKRSDGDSADCDQTGEEYCFASNLGGCQDPNCYCCGDDEKETWSVFASGEKLENVIINGSCENGRWVERTTATSTLYDLWTSITS